MYLAFRVVRTISGISTENLAMGNHARNQSGMECGGKRSATPLWMVFPLLKFADKARKSGVALRLPPHSILPFQRWGVFVEYVQLLGVEVVDCLHLRRCGCPLKPCRTAPGILVGHRNQSMFYRISMCVAQTSKIGFFVGQTRLAEIVPDLPARLAFQFVNPFGGLFMKPAQHLTHAAGSVF